MNEYEKLHLLYLAHIAGLLDMQITNVGARAFVEAKRRELASDLRIVASVETLKMLGDWQGVELKRDE